MAIQVLVVDDNSPMRSTLVEVLKSHQMEVATAETGKKADELLGKTVFDLVFVKKGLPDVSHVEFMDLVKDVSSNTAVIMMIDAYDVSGADEAYQWGFLTVLLNPFTPASIETALEKFQAHWNAFQKMNHQVPSEMLKLLAMNFAQPLRLKKEKVDLNILVNELVEESQLDALKFYNITISAELFETPVWIHADPGSIKGCLQRLLANSIHAIRPHEGKVTFSLKTHHHQAVIQVIDTGEGIPEENMKKLFTLYFTTKPNGHGFGLAEVKREIEAHQGTVDVTSKVGQGTMFTLKIPLLDN